jgi:heme-degrading monooxygenase HmoA
VNYENFYYKKIELDRSERYMIKIVEMDEKVTISAQIEANVGPVILINRFNVKPKNIDQFLKAWAVDAAYFKQQQGFISTQLHCGIDGSSRVFMNYAVWESTEHFKHAFNNPEFLSMMKDYPTSTVGSPHLFKKIAIPGICVD